MEDLAFILTFIITIALCLTTALYIRGRIKNAIAVYTAFASLISISVGVFAPTLLALVLDNVGIVQDFGHGGEAITAILNLGVGVIMVPIGIVLINWSPQKW